MKNVVLKAIPIVAILILVAKISSWFLDYPVAIKNGIDSSIFVFIGVYFIILGFTAFRSFYQWIVICSGLYLIVVEFFTKDVVLSVIWGVALIIPMVLRKFPKTMLQVEEPAVKG